MIDTRNATGGTVAWVLVTPAMAAEWMRRNRSNRQVNVAQVARFAQDMAKKRWSRNPQPVIFDADGDLIDGQHRLLAIIASGASIWLHVYSGASKDVRDNIDSGMIRRVSDQMAIIDGEGDSKAKLAGLRIIATLLGMRPPYSLGAGREWMSTYRDGVEWSLAAMDEHNGRRWQAAVYGALAFAWYRDPDQVAAFARRVYTGEDIRSGMPEYAIREFLVRHVANHGRAERRDTSMRVLSALRAAMEGRAYVKVQASTEAIAWFAARAPQPPVEAEGVDTPTMRAMVADIKKKIAASR